MHESISTFASQIDTYMTFHALVQKLTVFTAYMRFSSRAIAENLFIFLYSLISIVHKYLENRYTGTTYKYHTMSRLYRRHLRSRFTFDAKKAKVVIVVLTFILCFSFVSFLLRSKPASTSPLEFKTSKNRAYAYEADITTANIKANIGTTKEGATVAIQRGDTRLEMLTPLQSARIQTSKKDTVVFSANATDAKLEYSLTSKGIKENIVLSKAPSTNRFTTLLKATNLILNKSAEGIPIFTNRAGEYQFHFERPYAEDASGNRTYSVTYKISPTQDPIPSNILGEKTTGMNTERQLFGLTGEKFSNSTYTVITEVDPHWLMDPKRVYPIKIDPTVTHDSTATFATGTLNRVFDTGSGSNPSLQSYYQELPTDIHTAGLWHFNETADNTCTGGEDACDATINANDGTATGTTINTSTQRLGSAARTFDGVDDFITVADSATLTFLNNTMTAEAWIKRNGVPAAAEYVLLKGAASNWEYAVIVTTGGLVQCQMWTAAGVGIAAVVSVTSVVDNNWHHVACVSNGNIFSVYIDGVLDNTSTTFSSAMTNGTAALTIGDRADVANSEFQGDIDEIRLSSVPRTSEEIKFNAQRRPYAVYTSPVVEFDYISAAFNGFSWDERNVMTGDGETASSSTGLRAAWNFNETSGTTVANSAGAGSCGGTPANCDGVLTNVGNTTGQDVAPSSGWTANDRRWGAGALNFDGSNDFVDLNPNSGGLDIAASGDFSVEAWIKGTANGKTIFIAQNDADHGLLYFTVGPTTLTGTNNKLVVYLRADGVGAPTQIFSGVTTINDYQWHHVALTAQTSGANRSITLYVDGRVDATGTFSQNAALTFSAGGGGDAIISAGGGGFTFLGAIDTVRFWARSLPPHEILSNYNAAGMEMQTRVGSDATPDDGGWEEWRPVTSETTIEAFENVQGIATPSATLWPGAQIATSSSTIIKTEADSALKVTTGLAKITQNAVAMWRMDETSGTGAYIKDQVKTSVSNASTGDGADGAITLSSSTNLNTTVIAAGRSFADGIAYRVGAPADSASSVDRFSGSDTISNGIVAGDEVVLINLQGTSGDNTDVGNYEFMEVQSVSASTITFTTAITKSFNGTTPANQKVVVQRVPNYTNVTLQSGGILTASAFDNLTTTPTGAAGYRTGIVAIRASGTVDIQSGGSISGSAIGYGGGSSNQDPSIQGTSYTGTGALSQAANGGAGGGGDRETSNGAVDATGGGGAGHGAAGAAGGSAGSHVGGSAGGTYGTAALTKLYLGSGGGGGGGDWQGNFAGGAGGRGGGIVFVSGNTITVAGTVPANGATGANNQWGGGGGGAGGSVYLTGSTVTLGASLVTATAGTGGSSTGVFGSNGGAGGVGRIFVVGSAISGSTSPVASTDTLQNGTPNSATLVEGFAGKGRSFNGSSSYISVPDTADLDLTGGTFTMSLWVKPGSTQVANADIFSKHGTGNAGYALEMNGAANSNVYYFAFGTGAGFQCAATTITLRPNTWQHVTITKSGTSVVLYLNGVSTNTCTAASATVAGNADLLYFGRFSSGGGRFWNGSMDEVLFQNTAFSANEVAELYRAGRDHKVTTTVSSTDLSAKKMLPFYIAADRPGTYLETQVGESGFSTYDPDASTVAFWHLDEQSGSGAYIQDATGGTHTGTPAGTTFVDGKLGKARRFNGTSDSIQATTTSALNFNQSDPFTLDAWVYTAAVGAQRYIINKQQNNTDEFSTTLQMTAANKFSFVAIKQNVGSTEALGTTTINAGQWYHVAGVSDGTTIYLYVNGVLEASATISITGATQSLANVQLGRLYNNTLFWSGYIDEARISNVARSASDVRQAYESGLRAHPITIDFVASLDSGNLIADSSDTSFTVNATSYGFASMGSNIYVGDKIIVKENIDGTEYIAQGIITTATLSTGAVTIASWDTGSTFPSGGYTASATVFKWQREYWDITGPLDTQVDAITRWGVRVTNGDAGRTVYIDDLRSAGDYLTTPTGSTVTSSIGYKYFQYRSIMDSHDAKVSSALVSATLNYTLNSTPATPTLDAPTNGATDQLLSPLLQTTTTDADSDYLRYKIELCTNVGMSANCQTFDQTLSQTGWSGQNTQGGTAYTSGTQATYTIQTPLTGNTTYYWRSYAIDPAGTNIFSGTQTPNSFTTNASPNTPTLDSPADGAVNQSITPVLRTTTTDSLGDYLRYKIELCTNVGMSANCQTFDQTLSQTGWSGQNTQGGTAYTSGTQAVYTVQAALTVNTTYYWRSYAIDPGGGNTWSGTQTPRSFTTTNSPTAPSDLLVNGLSNPTTVPPGSIPYFSAIYNDPNVGDTSSTYQIQVSTNPNMAQVTHWDTGLAAMTTTTTGDRSPDFNYAGTALAANTTYYWRIRFRDAGGSVGTYSDIEQFRTGELHTTNCTAQKNGLNTQIVVKWANTNTINDGYTIERNVDGAGFAAFDTTAASGTSVTDNTVSSGHTYAYRVKATGGAGSSDWCITQTLSLQSGNFMFDGLRMDGLQIF